MVESIRCEAVSILHQYSKLMLKNQLILIEISKARHERHALFPFICNMIP